MDSFLSGFSHSYGGASQIGQGYTGNIVGTGNAATGNNGAQGVDVTQLQPGDAFRGEIASVNGEDVQIQLANGQFLAAKLEHDVQVALGQVLTLQVQSNKDNRVVLKPVYDNHSQMLRVGEAALRAAHLSVNDKNLTLVSTLIENGMSINKNNLMAFNRLTLQNPQADIADLIKLNKLQLPVTDSNLTQVQNYQNMEYRLLDGIKDASEEILKLYDTLTGNQNAQGSPEAAGQAAGLTAGQSNPETGVKFMEQVLSLFAGEEGQGEESAALHNGQTANVETGGQNPQTVSTNAENGSQSAQVDAQAGGQADLSGKLSEPSEAAETAARQGEAAGGNEKPAAGAAAEPLSPESGGTGNTQGNRAADGRTDMDTVLGQLKGEKPQALPNKIVGLIHDGKLDAKGLGQLLSDTEIGGQLTTGQKSKIFQSEPFKSMLRSSLQKQWTLSPQDLTQEGKVEDFYQKLARESIQLSRMMNEAMQSGGQGAAGAQSHAMQNISENVEFINQMNQMFSYVQLPLKLGDSQAHGDLYVYTNKKNMARKDGMLTAFLHLDMDHLGALDVSIALQTERNQVTTKFYLDEDSLSLVEEHIGELIQGLSKKGYQCKSMVLEKNEDKTVLEHIEEQVAGGNAVLSYQTFDTRA